MIKGISSMIQWSLVALTGRIQETFHEHLIYTISICNKACTFLSISVFKMTSFLSKSRQELLSNHVERHFLNAPGCLLSRENDSSKTSLKSPSIDSRIRRKFIDIIKLLYNSFYLFLSHHPFHPWGDLMQWWTKRVWPFKRPKNAKLQSIVVWLTLAMLKAGPVKFMVPNCLPLIASPSRPTSSSPVAFVCSDGEWTLWRSSASTHATWLGPELSIQHSCDNSDRRDIRVCLIETKGSYHTFVWKWAHKWVIQLQM